MATFFAQSQWQSTKKGANVVVQWEETKASFMRVILIVNFKNTSRWAFTTVCNFEIYKGVVKPK